MHLIKLCVMGECDPIMLGSAHTNGISLYARGAGQKPCVDQVTRNKRTTRGWRGITMTFASARHRQIMWGGVVILEATPELINHSNLKIKQ